MRAVPIAMVLALIASGCGGGDRDPYAPLHQSTRQEIPGTFGYDLVPVDGFTTDVDPARAWRELPGADRGGDVSVTLAEVENPAEGVAWGPVVGLLHQRSVLLHGQGRLREPVTQRRRRRVHAAERARAGGRRDLGEFRAVFEAYDADLDWLPDRAGSPDQVPGATRFQ